MQKPSTAVLIAANLLVVVLALSQRWGYYSLILVCWFEAMIIGAYGLARMCVACWFGDPLGKRIGMADRGSRFMLSLFLGGFYILKFGGFALGMGLWVALTPGFLVGGDGGDGFRAVTDALSDVGPGVLFAAAVMFVSHGVSFITNFIGRGEYRRRNAIALLFGPYLRMILVLVVLAAGFAAALAVPELHRMTGFTAGVLLAKLVADALSHTIEHRRREGRPGGVALEPDMAH